MDLREVSGDQLPYTLIDSAGSESCTVLGFISRWIVCSLQSCAVCVARCSLLQTLPHEKRTHNQARRVQIIKQITVCAVDERTSTTLRVSFFFSTES